MTMLLPGVGLGTAPIGGLYTLSPEADAIDAVQHAFASGIRFFDTAPHYGAGVAEDRLGHALKGLPRDDYVLSTKVGRLVTGEGTMTFDFSRDGVLRSIDESMRRLQVDRIDILHMHDPDAHFRQAVDEAYPVLAELRDQGAIRAIGVGMNQWRMPCDFVRETDIDCMLLAGRYTLLEQEGPARHLFPLCLERGVQVIAGGVFNSGILASGAHPEARYNYRIAPHEIQERIRRIEAICAEWGVSLRTAAVQFPLRHPAVASIVVGTRAVHKIDDLTHDLATLIPEGFWDDLALRIAPL
jgi:D-threo-aldose 1-dehydrogenase